MMSARNSFMALLCSVLLANTLPAATFSGSVMDALDGTTLPGTEVALFSVNGTSWTAMTGEDGGFLLEAPTGRYELNVEHAEYQSYSQGITLPEAGLVREIALMPVNVETASMSGIITDSESGDAVVGATVVATSGQSTFSDRDGYYELHDLAPTMLEFQVAHPLYQLYDQTTFLDAGDNEFNVELTPREIDPGNAWLFGTVISADLLLPVPDARITLDGDTMTTTDPAGGFQVFQLEPGTYSFAVVAEDFVTHTASLIIEAGTNHQRVVLSRLGDGEPAVLSGFVYGANGEPLSQTHLRMESVDGTVASTHSIESGYFFFPQLREGEWTLDAHHEGYVNNSWPLLLQPGENEFDLSLVEQQQELSGIEGRVLNVETGAAVPNANIVIHHSGGATIVLVDDEGHFFTTAVQAGLASASITAVGFDPLNDEFELLEEQVLEHDFLLTPHELPQEASLSGYVTDGLSGEPLADAELYVSSLIYDCGTGATCNDDGYYEILDFCHGPVSITVELEGYLPYSTQIMLSPGENEYDIELRTFEQEEASLSGCVTQYESGDPVVSTRVRVISQTTWLFMETLTDEEGNYSIEDYVSGPSTLRVIVDDFPAYNEQIDLAPGENTIDIVLGDPGPGAASLSGTVTNVETGEPIHEVEIVTGDYQFSLTDDDGHYHFPQLDVGEMVFWVHHPFYGSGFSFTLDLEPGENTHDFEMRLHGNGGEAASLLVTTYNGVSGEPLSGVEIFSDGTSVGVTDDTGVLNMPNLISGHTVLMALLQGYSMAHEHVWLQPGENEVGLNLFPDVQPPHLVNVYGHVVDAVSREPIVGAQVEVTLLDSNEPVVAVSDAEGFYDLLLEEVDQAYINVYCNVEGYIAREYEVFVLYTDDVDLDVILMPEDTNMGIVRGRVTYEAGHPAPAVVWAISANSFDYFEPVEASGSYSMILPPGEYYIGCSLLGPAGHQIYTEFYDDVMFLDEAEPVTVDTGAILPDINFELPMLEEINIHLSGQVCDTNGDPLVGATLRFWRDDVELEEYATPTDQFGNYDVTIVMDRLPIVPFSFSAQYDGYLMEFFSGASSFVDATHFLLQDDVEIENADFSLIETSGALNTYSGRVFSASGVGMPSAMVAAFNPDGGIVAAVPTSNDGSFSIAGLTDAPVVLMYYAPGHAPLFSGGSLDLDNAVIAEPGYWEDGEARLPVTADPEGDNQLTGVIRDEDGRPLGGALVLVEDQNSGELRSVFSNGAGRYAINGLASSGTYRTYISLQGYYSQQLTFATDASEDLVNIVDAALVSRTNTTVGEKQQPESMQLLANYPNPFNPTTTIPYVLPEASRVSLGVYNLQGALVQQLVNGVQAAGEYELQFYAGNLASGVYLIRLESDAGVQTRKLMLIK